MSVTGFIFLALAAVVTAVANLLLTAGIRQAGGFSPASLVEVVRGFFGLLFQPLFAAGFVAYFVAALIWFRVLASEPLSTAYPVLVGLTFVLVSSGAVFAFGEPLSWRKGLGLFVILAGIAITSMSNAAQLQ